jgi:Flp pilus assembly protein CpaB
VSIALTPEQALRRPWRLDGRKVAGLFLFLVVVAGTLLWWDQATLTRSFVVAARELPAGATLSAADLAVARLAADEVVVANAVPAEGRDGLVGRVLAEPVHAGELLLRPHLATGPRLGPDEMALTVPVGPASAAGGRIRPGDQVRVFATFARGRPESRTEVVLERATVYGVGSDEPPAVVGGAETGAPGRLGWATLVVSGADAARLARARHDGDVDLALLPPAR